MASDPFAYLNGKTVLVTGAAGTIGSRLVEEVAAAGARRVRALDHGESELFFLYERLRTRFPVTPLVGDIRDIDRVRMAMHGVDVVFHAAALKHVELGEYNPFEVVETNLRGLDNIIRAALDADVGRVIFTSSDKAVNPTNVMGASKMMGERLVSAANDIRGSRSTRFSSVRFGNVLGSRGSVVPIFAEAAMAGEPLRLTHAEMSRYVMTVAESARLVVEAGGLALGGEVFVTKMHSIRISDLAQVIIDELSHARRRSEIVHTQPRSGEKLYEELVSADELPRSFESDRMIVVLSERHSSLGSEREAPEAYSVALKPLDREWHSGTDRQMTLTELRDYVRKHELLRQWKPV